jgi:hypothetical protein
VQIVGVLRENEAGSAYEQLRVSNAVTTIIATIGGAIRNDRNKTVWAVRCF